MENIYYPRQATLKNIKEETPTIKTYRFKLDKKLKFKAGQFMQLTVPGIGEAPFTPSSAPGDVGEMEITIMKTGKVTDKLHDEVKVGDTIALRGPFGKGYPMDKFDGKEVLVVGGGVGLAPLRALIYALFDKIEKIKKIHICYGAKSPADQCFKDEYKEWESRKKVSVNLTIDKPHPDWKGRVGLVTCLLEKDYLKKMNADIANSYVVSCGPEVMLKFVTFKLLDVGFKPEQIYLSMNRRMSCGVGKCARCNIGPYYLCKDGPDMCYADIKDYPNVFG
ncbi:FAD/NAD(P)-binding protein [candidate division WOR-3 bacterium]|nr:FAD/NAD(P)-binding protein [candidate division WOR-3 bacterium]